jgi:cytochrome c peroxidase
MKTFNKKMLKSKIVQVLIVGVALIALGLMTAAAQVEMPWTPEETAAMRALWLGSLPDLPPDPSNEYGDDPRAAALGYQLFYDQRFSANGAIACGTCHRPDRLFQDGLPLAQGIGTTTRRTMTIVGTAYSPWLFWDGRKDSLWAQATGPMENAVEHGGNRTQFAHLIEAYYRDEYEALFGALPDLDHLPAHAGPVADVEARTAWEALSPEDQQAVTVIYANMGKAIAAYERLLMPGASHFDAYVEAVLDEDTAAMNALFTTDESAGLRLFLNEAHCTQCHNGPLLTDNYFHNTGVPSVDELPDDVGRTLGAQQVQADEFNCLSSYSDAGDDDCAELRFMVAEGDELMRAFRPPSLRNVAERAPYMHAGQFASLDEVLNHYNTAPAAPSGASEIHALNLSDEQLQQLIAFLHTLSGPLDAPAEYLEPPESFVP